MSDEESLDIADSRLTELRDLLLRIAIADPASEVERINISFSGGGDSGDIESVEADPKSDVVQAILDEDEVNELFNNILTQDSGMDWWNNEGGFGTMTINIKERTIDLDMNINVQTSEPHPMRATI
jgi:hypothetical protein